MHRNTFLSWGLRDDRPCPQKSYWSSAFKQADIVALVKVISGNTETYNVAVNKAEVLKTLKVLQRERPSTSVQKPSCAETFSFRHDVQQDTKKDCEYKGSVVPEICRAGFRQGRIPTSPAGDDARRMLK